MTKDRNVHIDEDCTSLSGEHKGDVFFNCEFKNLRGLTLQNCDLNRSKFTTDQITEALGFTITLNCLSFRNVEYSPLLFDLLVCLMLQSKGNDEKRAKLLDVIGRERAYELLSKLKHLE